MRIALGADHAGVALKEHLKHLLHTRGIAHQDFGTMTTAPVDYPDVAACVAHAVAAGRFERGILVCGSGLGMAIAANRVAGVRAVAVADEASARLGREHNDANVLALGARLIDTETAARLVHVFLDTPFSGGRHQQRLDKLAALDRIVPDDASVAG
jgi:ribose 5-phosphate isomerase B